MKAMIFSDLITSKNAFVQLLLISIVICGFLAWGTGEVIVGTAAMATMAPLMYLFSIFAYDEMNGWERFRMTLPLTKHQVAYGRYVSMLIVSVVSMLAAWLISFVFIAIIQAWGGFGTSAEFAAPESPPRYPRLRHSWLCLHLAACSTHPAASDAFWHEQGNTPFAASRGRDGRACERCDRKRFRWDRHGGRAHLLE